MKVEIKTEPGCGEPRVIIICEDIDEEIRALLAKINTAVPQVLTGFREGSAQILPEDDVYRVYTAKGKVYAVTGEGEYSLRPRLYELAERLERQSFARISNTEIINLKKVRNFDLSFTGTICVIFDDGTTTFVSRRYVGKIKQVLGI